MRPNVTTQIQRTDGERPLPHFLAVTMGQSTPPAQQAAVAQALLAGMADGADYSVAHHTNGLTTHTFRFQTPEEANIQ